MGKNPQVTATAFKKAKAKMKKIAQLSITPDMSEDEIDAIVMDLAEAKAIENNAPVGDFVKGQQWYVQSLVDFSGMTPQERLDLEYEDVFGEVASEEELLALLADPVVEEEKVEAAA